MGTKELSLELESQLSQLHRVEAFIESLCDEYNVYNNYFSNIMVAVTEAFLNAVIHGNKLNVSKKILLSFKSSSSGLLFTIEDQGEGFDIDSIPDPTKEKLDASNGGRGIYLIKHLSDEVQFINNGRKIEMLFKISSINYESSLSRANMFKEYVSLSVKNALKSNG